MAKDNENDKKNPALIRRRGTDDNEYEQSLCAYYFIKCGLDDSISQFTILNNVEGLGSFDDIVVSFERAGIWREYVVQVKQSGSNMLSAETLLSKKNFLSLSKESNSYKHVKTFFESDTLVFKDKFENCTLALFTNAPKNSNMEKHIINMPTGDNFFNIDFKFSCWEDNCKFKFCMCKTDAAPQQNKKKGHTKWVQPDPSTILITGKKEFCVQCDINSKQIDLIGDNNAKQNISEGAKCFSIPFGSNNLTLYCQPFTEENSMGLLLTLPPGHNFMTISGREYPIQDDLRFSLENAFIGRPFLKINGIVLNSPHCDVKLTLKRHFISINGHVFKLKKTSALYKGLQDLEYGKRQDRITYFWRVFMENFKRAFKYIIPIKIVQLVGALLQLVGAIEPSRSLPPSEFGDRVVIFCQQADIKTVKFLANRLLACEFNELNTRMITQICNFIFDFVKESCEKKGQLTFFTHNLFKKVLPDAVFLSIMHKLCEVVLSNVPEHLKLSSNCLKRIENCIENGEKMVHLICKSSDEHLLKLSIMQSKWILFDPKAKDKPMKIYLDLKTALSYEKWLPDFLSLNNSVLLILDCMNHYKNGLPESFQTTLSKITNKIVILLSNISPGDSEGPLQDNMNQLNGNIVEFSFSDFVQDSQSALLEREVFFQGEKTFLKFLLGEGDDFRSKLTNDVLRTILHGREVVSFGVKLEKPDDAYLPRTIYSRNRINQLLVIREKKDFYFVVSELGKNSEIEKAFPHAIEMKDSSTMPHTNMAVVNVKFEIPNLTKFEKFHVTEFKNGFLKWNRSIGGPPNKGLFEQSFTRIKEDEINVVSDRLILVVDDPGSGKSSYFKSLAYSFKKIHPDSLVLKIHLNDFCDFICYHNFNDQDDIVAFLCHSFFNSSDEFEKCFIESFLHRHCFIFLDGYDEVSPKYGSKMSRMIEILINETKVEKLFVSSRKYIKIELGNAFYPVYSLLPFKEIEQQDFFKRRWGCKIKDENVLMCYISDAISLVSRSMRDKHCNFLGLPFQMQMLSEIFDLEEIYSPNIIPKRMNLLKLFDKFINLKIKNVLTNTFSVKTTLGHYEVLHDGQLAQVLKTHQVAALIFVFGNLEGIKGVDSEVDFKKIEDGREVHGIISNVLTNRPLFVHKCYAEYYCAIWFAEHFVLNSKFIEEKFFEPGFKTIRYLFDLKLADKSDMHIRIIMNDKSLLDEVLDSHNVDFGGRSILHLAVAYCSSQIVEKILISSSDLIDLNDKVLEWSPMRYADATPSSWRILGLLLKFESGVSDLRKTVIRIEDNKVAQMAIYAAIRFEYTKLFEYLYSNRRSAFQWLENRQKIRFTSLLNLVLNLNETSHAVFENFKPLHAAAIFGSVKIFEKLLPGADLSDKVLSLMCATAHEHQEVIQNLLKNNLSVNERVENYTALHVACIYGKLSSAKILISCGANVNALLPNLDESPLCLSIKNGHYNVAELLIENGADVSLEDRKGTLPLNEAASAGQIEFLKFCREKGVKSETLGEIFMAVVGNTSFESVDLAGKVNSVDEYGKSPLHYAVELQRYDHARELLRHGARTDIVDDFEVNPVYIAINNDDEKMLEMIVSNGGENGAANRGPRGEMPLHLACENGRLSVVRLLVTGLRVDLDEVTKYNDTALLIALRFGHAKVADFLIDEGCDIHVQNDNKETPLLLAAEKGFISILKKLLDRGADINKTGKNNQTGLVTALRNGRYDVAELLISRGIRLNATGSDEHPLHLAASEGQEKIIQLCIDRGCDVNVLSKYWGTPLQIAASKRNLQLIHFLLKKGADLSLGNARIGTSLLHRLALNQDSQLLLFISRLPEVNVDKYPLLSVEFLTVIEGNVEGLELINWQGSINKKDECGWSLLHFAVHLRHEEIVKYLLSNPEIDVNAVDLSGFAPLHIATLQGNLKIIKLLLPKTNILDLKTGDTPLSIACKKGRKDIVEFFIKYGASFQQFDLSSAILRNRFDVAEYLVKNCPSEQNAMLNLPCSPSPLSPIHFAVKNKSTSFFKLLIKRGVDLNVHSTASQNTPLDFAFELEDSDAIESLLKNGADLKTCSTMPLSKLATAGNVNLLQFVANMVKDVSEYPILSQIFLCVLENNIRLFDSIRKDMNININLADECGKTPLFYATERNFPDMVKALLEAGAKPDWTNNYRNTPLDIAIYRGNETIKDILIRKKADAAKSCGEVGEVSLASCNGFTSKPNTVEFCNDLTENCLMLALKKKQPDIAGALIEHGAVFNIGCKMTREIPLFLASKFGFLDVVKLMITLGADINVRNIEQQTCLMVALKNQHFELASFLFENGAPLDVFDCRGYHTFHYAVIAYDKESAEKFLKTDPRYRNLRCWGTGDTPLILSARLGYVGVMELLINSDSDIYETNILEENSLIVALKNNQIEACKYLINTLSSVDDIVSIVMNFDCGTVFRLLRQRLDALNND